MSIKAKLEALIYAAEDPITLDQMIALLKDDLLALKTALPAQESVPPEFPPMEPHPEHAENHLGAGGAGYPSACSQGRAGQGQKRKN